jgi:hypothetical protein
MTHADQNGTVVTATDMTLADVLIDGERIQADRYRFGDAGTRHRRRRAGYVMPAASTAPPTWSCRSAGHFASDDFATGTAAASLAGVPRRSSTSPSRTTAQSLSAGLDRCWRRRAEVAHRLRLHLIVREISDQVLREMMR